MLARRHIALPLLVLAPIFAVGCSNSDDGTGSGQADVSQGPDLVFAGPKAPQGGNASAPSGSLAGKNVGDAVTISYAPQRVRGCDGGGWAQDTTLAFLDRNGNTIGAPAEGSGFGGTGMVPRGKAPLTLSARIPSGAVTVQVLGSNDGGAHRASDSADTPHTGDNLGSGGQCFDTIDGRGWRIPIGGSSSGTSAPAPTPAPTTSHTLVPGVYTATDTRSQSATLTVRRADAHNLRYDVTLTNKIDGQTTEQAVHNMWGTDDGLGNGQFVTPAVPGNDCEFNLAVANGVAKLTQGQSTCASQGFGPQVIADGTYTLTKAGAPPSDPATWTGSFVEPSPGTIELDVSVQTAPLPNSTAFSFVYAYQLVPGAPALNGIAKVSDPNQPATSTVSGCALSFEFLLDRMTVLADGNRAECTKLGFVEEQNAFEILPPKAQ